MNIAICDDNPQELAALVQLLTEYAKTRENISFTAYTNATDLLSQIKNQDYDLLLLDILMPGLTGLAAAEEIRRYNEKVEILFLTSSQEYAVDSYRVRAYYYLIKPANKQDLFPLLDRLYNRFQAQDECLHLKNSQRILSLPFHRIEVVEVINKTLFFHLSDGSDFQMRCPLSDCEKQLLSRPEFTKTHRSYLVNLQHMQELGNSEFISTSGRHIPVARGQHKAVREAYINYLFSSAKGDDL